MLRIFGLFLRYVLDGTTFFPPIGFGPLSDESDEPEEGDDPFRGEEADADDEEERNEDDEDGGTTNTGTKIAAKSKSDLYNGAEKKTAIVGIVPFRRRFGKAAAC